MHPKKSTLHFAVTSHGLGHLTRTLAVIQQARTMRPQYDIQVTTTVDPSWINGQLDFEVLCRSREYEPGALQKNCFEVDTDASCHAYRSFLESHPKRLEEEKEYLRSQNVVAVVSDISAIAVRAAAEVGIPSVGISNFTWDWILEPWCADHDDPMVRAVPGALAADYRSGTHQLRLPYGPESSSFPASESAPLVSRVATKSRDDVRALLGVDDGPLAVVCPGGWSADDWPKIHARAGEFRLVTVGALPVTSDGTLVDLGHEFPPGVTFPDLVAAAEVVLGKPGYGLASECATHRTPFAMIERPEFRETPYLVAEFQANGRGSTSTIEQFFSGEWEGMLTSAIDGGSPWAKQPENAAGIVAARALELCGI